VKCRSLASPRRLRTKARRNPVRFRGIKK
jgi:hypothetical protein